MRLPECYGLWVVQASTYGVLVGNPNFNHHGWKNGKRLDAVAYVTKNADILAFEEVMDESAVTQLEHELKRQTGEEWSHTVGRKSYRESYPYSLVR